MPLGSTLACEAGAAFTLLTAVFFVCIFPAPGYLLPLLVWLSNLSWAYYGGGTGAAF